MKKEDKKSIAYEKGYKVGLDNSPIKNPYDIMNDGSEFDDWSQGYNAGYRDFCDWVNKMCN